MAQGLAFALVCLARALPCRISEDLTMAIKCCCRRLSRPAARLLSETSTSSEGAPSLSRVEELSTLARYLTKCSDDVFSLLCSEYDEADIVKISLAASREEAVLIMERWRRTPYALNELV